MLNIWRTLACDCPKSKEREAAGGEDSGGGEGGDPVQREQGAGRHRGAYQAHHTLNTHKDFQH